MYRNRIIGLIMIAALMVLVLATRLFQLQVWQGEYWQLESFFQRTQKKSLPFNRGSIFDRYGEVLAMNERFYTLDFAYRDFRRNHRLGQVTHALSELEGKEWNIFEVAANPQVALRKLALADSLTLQNLEPRERRENFRFYAEKIYQLNPAERMLLRNIARRQATVQGPLQQIFGRDQQQLLSELEQGIDELSYLERVLQLERGSIFSVLEQRRQYVERSIDKVMAASSGQRIKRSDLEKDYGARTTTVLKDISFAAADFLTLQQDHFPGFSVEEQNRRIYMQAAGASIIGVVQRPTDQEIQKAQAEAKERQALARILDRTEEEQAHFAYLLERRDTAYRLDEEMGRQGLESSMENTLRGKRGWQVAERVFSEDANPLLQRTPPVHGKDLVLTLSMELQKAAEQALQDGYGGLQDLNGAIVVLDVRNGEVLAMATHPTYTQDQYRANYGELVADARRPLFHRACNPYIPPAPGSLFKLMVAYAALEEQLISVETQFDCQGIYKNIKCNRSAGHGSQDLHAAIQHSCNVYFYKVGELLGVDKMAAVAQRFGFRQKTGIEITEVEGALKVYPNDPRRFAIGQTLIAVTPLQVARAYALLANGGYLIQPHLVKIVGREEVMPPAQENKNFDPDILRTLARGLKAVVQPGGTAAPEGDWDLNALGAVGKTGTAEVSKTIPDHAWFAGYYPEESPVVAFAVYIERIGKHGGDLAAPLAYRVLASPAMQKYMEEAR